jgi:hypothetical protein|tara:strand:- start:1805 stop:2770 length:966 start_codon:yes stop_codon:yes gene_type:complete
MKYNKVIIWGYPLYSHTHSYVHHAYHKAFTSLGYETYWFHDDEYPEDFDYTNSLFIGEGFADKNIPINDSSAYFIMYCPSPKKYESADKFVDVRTVGVDIKDHVYSYSLDKEKTEKVGPGCYFEAKSSGKVHLKNDYVDYEIDSYDKLFISWATNLLPEEIDFESMFLPRKNVIHYCGTISGSGVCENYSTFLPFVEECNKHNIQVTHNDPWQNPLPFEEVMRRVQESVMAPDIRGPEHLRTRVVTCRVFKNISYGHLGVTNSEEIYNEMDGNCVYNSDTRELFYDGMSNLDNGDLILSGMKYVKENHTYINRVKSILSVL